MTALNKIPVSWGSWPGAPGVSTFYSFGGNLDNDTAAIRAFFNSLVAQIPSGITLSVPGVGDVIDDNDGKITGAWNATAAPAIVTGTGSGVYAGNAGGVVHWLTAGVANGHRIRGRTFIVPLISTAFDSGGSLSTTALSALRNAATAMIAAGAGDFRVWHRPVGGTGGSAAAVLTSSVPDLAITLRSRRV